MVPPLHAFIGWIALVRRAVGEPLSAFIKHASQICHRHHMLMPAANEYECCAQTPSPALSLLCSTPRQSSPRIKCKSPLYRSQNHERHRFESNTLSLEQVLHIPAKHVGLSVRNKQDHRLQAFGGESSLLS